VTIDSTAEIGGSAWLAGNDVTINGKLNGALKAYGRRVTVAGEVAGPLQLSGERLEVAQGAQIRGDVRYSSPNDIEIHPEARISGTVTRVAGPLGVEKPQVALPGLPPVRPLLLVGLLAAGTLLYWLFPRFTVTSARTVGRTPVKSLGLGAGIVFSGPPIILLLTITIIGIPIALAVSAAYILALLAGYLIAVFFVGERALGLVRRTEFTTGWHVLSFTVALIALALLHQVPYAGPFITLIAVVLGLGAMVLQAFTHYSDRK
jgi:hypothetical protein